MYIHRTITNVLTETFKKYPIITLVGPRQSGKTTLSRNTFPDLPYVNLEDIGTKDELEYDAKSFLERYKTGAIFDEVQSYPKILSYLQVLVDRLNHNSLFVLTGSNQHALSNAMSQSLAGRTAIFHIYPLTFTEVVASMSMDSEIFHGFYPKIFKDRLEPELFYSSYVQTYLERDVRQISDIKSISMFRKFIKLCAGRIGQLFNANSLANEIGVSAPTINNWLSILETSFIVFTLQPYHKNFGKRVIKTSKLYFTDVGLAAHLLDIKSSEQLTRDPLRGQLFENMVIMDIVKHGHNLGKSTSLYFFRDHNQNEVDLMLTSEAGLIPIEIKSSATFNPYFLKGLEYISKIRDSSNGLLVYSGSEESMLKTFQIVNYHFAANRLHKCQLNDKKKDD